MRLARAKIKPEIMAIGEAGGGAETWRKENSIT
jgi:hypothetical protein